MPTKQQTTQQSTQQPTQHALPSGTRGLDGADLLATVLVLTAAVVGVLWTTDVALSGWSTRAVAGVVLALGYLGCMTARSRMFEVYGAAGHQRAPLAYVVTTSLIGAAALLCGIAALVWSSGAMVVALLVAMVALWTMSTARHARVV